MHTQQLDKHRPGGLWNRAGVSPPGASCFQASPRFALCYHSAVGRGLGEGGVVCVSFHGCSCFLLHLLRHVCGKLTLNQILSWALETPRCPHQWMKRNSLWMTFTLQLGSGDWTVGRICR